MKEINVTGQKREALGKKASKTLRKEGFVPCNLYGLAEQDGKPVAKSFAIAMTELRKIIYTPHIYVINLNIDGGQLDMEISTLAEAALEICNSHGIGQNAPLQVADIGILDELQAAQDAAIAIEPPVQENPEPETDIPPDPAISVEARNAYGYTDDAMLPLTSRTMPNALRFSLRISRMVMP